MFFSEAALDELSLDSLWSAFASADAGGLLQRRCLSRWGQLSNIFLQNTATAPEPPMPFLGTLRDMAGQEYIVLQQTNLDLEQASATVISDLRCAMQQDSEVYTRKSPAIVQALRRP